MKFYVWVTCFVSLGMLVVTEARLRRATKQRDLEEVGWIIGAIGGGGGLGCSNQGQTCNGMRRCCRNLSCMGGICQYRPPCSNFQCGYNGMNCCQGLTCANGQCIPFMG